MSLTWLALIGCGWLGRDGRPDSNHTDEAVVDTDEAADSDEHTITVTPEEFDAVHLGGVAFHQVSVDGEGAASGTFSYALFAEPAASQVPTILLRPESCHLDAASAWFTGTKDVGPSVLLGVGSSTLSLPRNLTWEEGQITYLRDVESPDAPGMVAGEPLSLNGATTHVVIPNIPAFPETSFWPEFVATGTLHLHWTPTGSDFVLVMASWYKASERKPNVGCSLEDDGEAVIDTGLTELAGWSGIVSFAPVNRGRVTVADIGEIEIVATIPMMMHYVPSD